MNLRRRSCLSKAFALASGIFAGCTAIGESGSRGWGGDGGGFGPEHGGGGVGGGFPCMTARLSMESISEKEIVNRAYHWVDDFGSESRDVFIRSATGASTTATALSDPIPQPAVGIHNDTLYQVSTEVVDSELASTNTINIDPVSGTNPDDEVVHFRDLPPVDREKLATMGFGPDYSEDDFATLTIPYREAERENSTLVPTPTRSVIVWESGVRARISVDDSHPEMFYTYRISATSVAPDVESFGRQLREEYELHLTNLSSAERSIVKQAIANEYRVDAGEDPSDALASLVRRFWNHEVAPFETRNHLAEGNVAREYIVRYDGQIYRAEVIIDEDAFPSVSSGAN